MSTNSLVKICSWSIVSVIGVVAGCCSLGCASRPLAPTQSVLQRDFAGGSASLVERFEFQPPSKQADLRVLVRGVDFADIDLERSQFIVTLWPCGAESYDDIITTVQEYMISGDLQVEPRDDGILIRSQRLRSIDMRSACVECGVVMEFAGRAGKVVRPAGFSVEISSSGD